MRLMAQAQRAMRFVHRNAQIRVREMRKARRGAERISPRLMRRITRSASKRELQTWVLAEKPAAKENQSDIINNTDVVRFGVEVLTPLA